MDSDDDRVEVGQLDRHIPVPEWKRRTNATIKKYNCPTDCLGYGRQRLFGVPGKRTSPLTVVYLFFVISLLLLPSVEIGSPVLQ